MKLNLFKKAKKEEKKKKTKISKSNDALYKEIKPKNLFEKSEVIILTVATCILGIIMGTLIGYNMKKSTNKHYSPDMEEFIKNYTYITENNIADVSSTELIKGAIEGMLSTFEDTYSYVIDDEEQENFNIKLRGEYEGLGIEIVTVEGGDIYLYTVFEDSPADKAGLKAGDQLIQVDDLDMKDKTSSDIANYIKQNNKKSFDITVKRKDDEVKATIERDVVVINSVYKDMFEVDGKKIGYIYMSIFSNSSTRQFKQKLEELESEGMDSLIIDVRFNNGGHLTTATSILSLFLDSSHVIYQTDKNDKVEKFYSSGKVTKKYPIVVLQNGNSASASEMLAAALKEEYGATIVGNNSFGKGTVQELITLSDGTQYKFTTKKWLTPKGNWINEKGVEVDVKVDLDNTYYENPTNENDNQLQKAIDILKEK